MEQLCQKRDVYTIVTDRIIQQLEQGTIPWRKPWTSAGLPQNLITKKPYRGMNVWMLASLGYERNLFLTFKQASELGGYIRKGEKSHFVLYTKKMEIPKEATNESMGTKEISLLRYYQVFNIAQCVGIQSNKIPELEIHASPIEKCEEIIRQMPKCPPIKCEKHRAFFNVQEDYVNMPRMETFQNNEEYYSTLFHELVHSTGHASRLNRKELTESKQFASTLYSVEELIAEIGACYLKSYTGITGEYFKYNISYIQSWLNKLRNDKRYIFSASTKAQKAVDYILNIQQANEQVPTP